ncbi:MAG: ice-binding family protein [Actinomycetota bacterium]
MRRTQAAIPIAFIAVLAAGALLLSAEAAERGVGASRRGVDDNAHGTAVHPLAGSPIVDPIPARQVRPTTPSVRAPTRPPLVDRTPAAVVPRTAAGRFSSLSAGGLSSVAPVNLGAASSFAILTGSGITDVYASRITGNVGASPITGDAIGLTCPEVTGMIYSVNAGGPLACRVTNAAALTAAVGDEESAYTDAAGRTSPDFVNLGAGQIGGRTLAPGLYKWSTGVSISADVTLTGGPNDVWIFQIAGPLTQASATTVRLAGGAQARNIFWQSAGAVTLGTGAHSEGTILAKTMIALNTGASTNGRLLAQTAVTLQQNRVTMAQ